MIVTVMPHRLSPSIDPLIPREGNLINRELLLQLDDLSAPGHTIDFLNSLRREKLFLKIKYLTTDDADEGLGQLQKELETHLCHPLLLPTAIAGGLLGCAVHLEQLNAFAGGNTLLSFDESLAAVLMDSFADCAESSNFVKYEERYYVGLYCFLLDSFKRGGKNAFAHCLHEPVVNDLIRQGYSKHGIRDFHNALGFSAHDVRWNAWAIFNMPMVSLAGSGSLREAAVLFNYGFKHNSRWHNITERAQFDFNELKRSFNSSAKSRDVEAIRASAEKLKIGEYFSRRSQRLYWWNPCEISAHGATDGIGERMAEMFSQADVNHKTEGGN